MLLWSVEWRLASWGFVAALLLVIRPRVGRRRPGRLAHLDGRSARLIGWFGIRGIGSLYYLMYAVNHGLDRELAAKLGALTLSTVVVSIVVHGVSVTPLMDALRARQGATGEGAATIRVALRADAGAAHGPADAVSLSPQPPRHGLIPWRSD